MKLDVKLENCYGIKKLEAVFDFDKNNAYAIYAPNGAMKSSMARTFQDIADGKESRDRIFVNRVSKRVVHTGSGKDLEANRVLVIRPYDEVLGHSEKTSTLLVNAELRKEYEELHIAVTACKEKFLTAIKAQAKTKVDVEKEISSTFTKANDRFSVALTRISQEILEQKAAPFADLEYDTVFDDKVVELLNSAKVKGSIAEYIKRYNELLAKSTYFKQGTFSYYNAATIAKTLADHGFFKAKHTLNLISGAKFEINNEKELEKVIEDEKRAITSDEVLRKNFKEMEKMLEKNQAVRKFQAYLERHEEILPALSNVESFREEVWKSYIFHHKELYDELMQKYKDVAARKAEIELQAEVERTKWQEVIDIFNSRFFVPFKLDVKNKVQVILGAEPIMSLGFIFTDGDEVATINREELLEALSTGEKKALYILNIIFEIEVRRGSNQEIVLIVDDIADSFDYKNKYAIIQYLKELSEGDDFKQIILTHNFDFFRTINSRQVVGYQCCLMATKSSSGLVLNQAAGIKNVFINDWKPNFFSNSRKRIASIPFLRNLIEFTKGEDNVEFAKLTSLLHWKEDSSLITQNELLSVYRTIFGSGGAMPDPMKLVHELIQEEAELCLDDSEGINFENKIVLSIAVRLRAEKYMIEKLANPAQVAAIKTNQTPALLRLLKKLGSIDPATIHVIDKVVLMTPENIHLNSFMYEPILDMSDEHLRKLYREVAELA
ncbi:phage infection protein [Roseomonas sp. KE2513]|uniref:hypothetical protein n=1 Tax=Roseomonas sp. KE2513 TaxID=2479202 RepID=UPI0018DFCD9C|nr:hypothetical protein [Roseomonas sp. KE2513]MBI0539083.1 phage infection protein [Roseomonas sp. KE2513]